MKSATVLLAFRALSQIHAAWQEMLNAISRTTCGSPPALLFYEGSHSCFKFIGNLLNILTETSEILLLKNAACPQKNRIWQLPSQLCIKTRATGLI